MLILLFALILQILDLLPHLLLSLNCFLLLLLLLLLDWIQSLDWSILCFLGLECRDCFFSFCKLICLLLALLAQSVVLIFQPLLVNTHLLHIQ